MASHTVLARRANLCYATAVQENICHAARMVVLCDMLQRYAL